MRQLKIVIALLLFPVASFALDLATMQNMAVSNRDVVQKYEATFAQSEQGLRQAKGGYYPAVDLSYTVNSLDEASLLEDKENSVVLGRVSWNLFAGFRDKYNIRSAALANEVESLRLDGIRQDVRLGVALAYLSVWERRANRMVAEAAFQTLEKVYRDGENRFQVGLIGKNELLKFRVDFDNADITLKAADAGLKKSVNSLSQQVGAAVTLEELDFHDFATLPSPVDTERYHQLMLEKRSEIKALAKLVDVGDAKYEAAKSSYYPRLDAVGSYKRYDNDYFNGNGDKEDDEWRGQLVMSVNLFQGFSTDAAVTGAKLGSRAAMYDLAELKTAMSTELSNLAIDFQVSLENVEVARRSIEQAEENLRITQLKYNEGLQQESDLLDAITALSRAKYNEVAVQRTAYLNNFNMLRMINGI